MKLRSRLRTALTPDGFWRAFLPASEWGLGLCGLFISWAAVAAFLKLWEPANPIDPLAAMALNIASMAYLKVFKNKKEEILD